MFFLGKKFLLANLIEKNYSVYEIGRKKYSVSTLCLEKYCFLFLSHIFFLLHCEAKKYIWTPLS